MGVAISSEFTRIGLTDPFTQAAAVSLATGAATLLTGLFFVALASLRLGSLGQLLPYPVISGYNSGIGWFLLVGGLKLTVDQPLGIDAAHLLEGHSIAQLAAVVLTAATVRFDAVMPVRPPRNEETFRKNRYPNWPKTASSPRARGRVARMR